MKRNWKRIKLDFGHLLYEVVTEQDPIDIPFDWEIGYIDEDGLNGRFMRVLGKELFVVVKKNGVERSKVIDSNFDKRAIPDVNNYAHLFEGIFPNREKSIRIKGIQRSKNVS